MAVRVMQAATDAFKYCASVQVAGILLKRILQEPYLQDLSDVEAVVVLLFVRSGETPLFNHGRSSYGAATDAFKYCKLRFR
jgi:hypothetical protein